METLTDIPFTLDADALMIRAHVEPGSEDAREFVELLAAARAAGRPKAAYREVFVEARGEDTVTLDRVTFTSRVLRRNLERVERAFAYVATCGREMDVAQATGGDPLKAFWWDAIKTELLGAAMRHLSQHLDRRYRLGKTAAMSPGSGDADVWPIEQQRELFALLGDVQGGIGVVLTGSCLMLPNKTVSGLRFQSEVDFRTCQLCHRAQCPSRGAPFDRAMWDAMQHA